MSDSNKKFQPPASSTWSLIKRLVRNYLKPYLKELGLALLFMLLASSMIALFAKLVEPVFDHILVNTRRDLIIPLSIGVFACFFTSGIATYIHTILMNRIGQSIVADIQRELFSRFLDLDLKFFHDNPSGELVARVVNDVNVMRNAVTNGVTGFGKSLLTLVMLVGLMFVQDARLASIVVLVFPFAALFVAWVGRRIRKISKNTQAQVGSLTSALTQIFQGIRQVKAYNMEDFEREQAGKSIVRVRSLVIKAVRVGNLSTPFNELLVGIAIGGVIIYGGNKVLSGVLTVGELTSFIAAFALAYEPMKRLAKLNNTLQMGLGAAERVFEMLDLQPTIFDKDGAIELDVKKPSITFDHVSFSYGEGQESALRDVSFTIPAGKVTALVGPSGSGKTTAMNLIPRFYDVGAGAVLIAGKDVRDLTLKSLRRHISLVSQDITIFNATARENIVYGRPGASEEEIINAAKAAAAHDFIMELPEGYDTQLGEQGVKLSGGQRQRIAIARAMLHDAPVLLLDEATSALDTESEKAIQAALEKLQKGRTTLVIAHRLSTIQSADQIIAFDQGRIAESGKHQELLAREGLYARMHRA